LRKHRPQPPLPGRATPRSPGPGKPSDVTGPGCSATCRYERGNTTDFADPVDRHDDYHLASTAPLRHQISARLLPARTQPRTTWAGTRSFLAEAEPNLSKRWQIRDVHLPLAAQHE